MEINSDDPRPKLRHGRQRLWLARLFVVQN